ncbi:MAG: zinc ribbon domain-containing protein [Mariniblastus sp.]|nr:zinc ribbon domain-containing protein [Mariniblastus sp.]
MPTYDYICDACEHAWELFQRITEDPIKKCPECGKKKAVRQFGTGAAIMFKGSGFYETDYRSDSYKKSAKADKKETSDSKSSDSSKKSGSSSQSDSSTSSDSSSKSKSSGKGKSDSSGGSGSSSKSD